MQDAEMTVPEHVCLVTRTAAAAVSYRLRSATFSAEEKVRAELQSELTLSHLLCPW